MTIADAYNFRRVDRRLTTSGLLGAAHLRGVGREGYDAIVNLLPGGHEHAVEDEADIVRGQGVDYVHIPVDFEMPTRADFLLFTETLDSRTDKTLHIHCAANYRVSVFYGLYATRKGLWGETESMEFIHSVWDPSAYPAWTRFMDTIQREIPGSRSTS